MKVSVVLTLLALVCLARTAPTPEPQKNRVLEFSDYYDDNDQHPANGKGLNATTTTTRRLPFVFPTRNQQTLPPKRITTTTIAGDIDELNSSYNDDSYYQSNATYHYLQNIRRRFKQLWEEIKKFFRNMNMSEIFKMVQQYFNLDSEFLGIKKEENMSHKDTSNEQKITTVESNRQRINQLLFESGIDPSDYNFNTEAAANQPSAFSKYSETKTFPSRPYAYVQQPPPPPPNINRRTMTSQSPSYFSERRTPPPPSSLYSQNIEYQSNDPEQKYSAEHYLRQIDQEDNPPVKVLKPNTQNVVYKKEIRIRYLQPPTPPPPAPIIIREKRIPPPPPESPLLIRERKPEPRTPPPLTIRERPPSPPPLLEPYVVEKPIPPPPPQPRQIIIERLPTPPPKPRTVIFEKWLPYKKVKRPVLLQKAPPASPTKPVRNVIIEYEPLKAYTVRRVVEEGVFRVDPNEYNDYTSQEHSGNIRIVDRIEDLPPPSEDILRALRNYEPSTTSHYRREQAYTPDLHSSSIPSPTFVPLKEHPQSKTPTSTRS